ncbi:hypothetical protein HGP16_11385 [Rhizobium sp. P40RR-XXII]|uniref:hypothetical protein n=1 Tax=Rhizobium sp. P40RR-XXII TaxID=2726739 RepID=UPI00145777B8|nr:hypothetical protein [Rhizobium sp. P40RR-XXII]NLS17159.1 hypothetical protein [Rhizobium sp. P40RR-XXII]
MGEAGLSSIFGGAVVFKNDATGELFLGVWGARNASRFRRLIRTNMQTINFKDPPSARLVFWQAEEVRPRSVRK